MQCDYQIDDIVRQTSEFLVYEASDDAGSRYTLIRMKYPSEILVNLRDGRFEKSLAELKALDHSCLRPVVDGGLDPVDGQPWVATRAWDGNSLEMRHSEGRLTPDDLRRIEKHGKSLIAGVVERAGSLSFEPSEIILSTAVNGEAIVTFSIDYLEWFKDVAMGYGPGHQKDAKGKLRELLKSLGVKQGGTPQKVSLATGAVTTPSPKGVERGGTVPQVQASAPQVLASAQAGSGGAKSWLIIGILAVCVVGGAWWALSKKKSSDAVEEAGEPEQKVEKSLAKADSKIVLPSEDANPSSEAQDVVPKAEPDSSKPTVVKNESREDALAVRPEVGFMSEVSAADADALERNVGNWIILSGKAQEKGEDGILLFEETALAAEVLSGSVEGFVGKDVEVVGRLMKNDQLLVATSDDIEVVVPVVEMPKKDVYGVGDEEQLRTMEGQEVSVQAAVIEVKSSGSGKTLYMVFNESRPEFAASVSVRNAEEGVDLEFLNSFDGKTIKVSGRVRLEKGWNGNPGRLLISISKKEQVELVD